MPLLVAMDLPKLCHLIQEGLLRAQEQVVVDEDTYHNDKFLRGWIKEQKTERDSTLTSLPLQVKESCHGCSMDDHNSERNR